MITAQLHDRVSINGVTLLVTFQPMTNWRVTTGMIKQSSNLGESQPCTSFSSCSKRNLTSRLDFTVSMWLLDHQLPDFCSLNSDGPTDLNTGQDSMFSGHTEHNSLEFSLNWTVIWIPDLMITGLRSMI